MINITVLQSGTVIGDVGKIIAYQGQQFSEPIKIVHPNLAGCQYYIQYKYHDTIYRNKLNLNDIVKIKIESNGYLRCQFIAINIDDGVPQFISKDWLFIINESLKPNYCMNNDIPMHDLMYKPQCYPNAEFNTFEAYTKIINELRNEENIRNEQITQLTLAIEEIKNELSMNNTTESIYDLNMCTTSGTYHADINSINGPSKFDLSDEPYILNVRKTNDVIIQEAYELDGDAVWSRTGTLNNDIIIWSEWSNHIVKVEEI